jgi:glycosyltransferase involved in cell wall biosynthesis
MTNEMTKIRIVPVSVVIPCYCCSEVLDRAIDSVLNQLSLPQEVILVDDGSPDEGETRSCMNRISERYPASDGVFIRLLSFDENNGPASARNAGWDAATQDYVAFLDADDSWHKDKLEVQVSWMNRHPEVALSGHLIAYRDNIDGLGNETVVSSAPVMFNTLLFKNQLLTSTVMVRKNLLYRFSKGERYSEDYALWLRMLANGCQAGIIKATLARAHRPAFSRGGLSSALWKMERAELRIYSQLVAEGNIGLVRAFLASFVSLLKFCRRVASFHMSSR